MRVGFDKTVPKRVQDHLFHVVDLLVRNGHYGPSLKVSHLEHVGVKFSDERREGWLNYLMEKNDYLAVEKMLYSSGKSCWLQVHQYSK